jgi:hypothetical protein
MTNLRERHGRRGTTGGNKGTCVPNLQLDFLSLNLKRFDFLWWGEAGTRVSDTEWKEQHTRNDNDSPGRCSATQATHGEKRTKSTPIVLMKVSVKLLSANRRSRQLLPTPESPISSSLNIVAPSRAPPRPGGAPVRTAMGWGARSSAVVFGRTKKRKQKPRFEKQVCCVRVSAKKIGDAGPANEAGRTKKRHQKTGKGRSLRKTLLKDMKKKEIKNSEEEEERDARVDWPQPIVFFESFVLSFLFFLFFLFGRCKSGLGCFLRREKEQIKSANALHWWLSDDQKGARLRGDNPYLKPFPFLS